MSRKPYCISICVVMCLLVTLAVSDRSWAQQAADHKSNVSSLVRVLQIDVPKQGGLIPDIKLGSGANMKIYGFFKASAVSDTASSGGPNFGSQDFPLPLLLADTGPTSDPQVHIKARAFRIGSQFEWVPKNSGFVVTGRVEADYEGDSTNQNSVNISSLRNAALRTRPAWGRLHTTVCAPL